MFFRGWAEREKDRQRLEHEEKTMLQKHEDLKRRAKKRRDFDLDDLRGAYMIQCETIEPLEEREEIPCLYIIPGAVATFHFRALEGVMHLSKTPFDAPEDDSDDSDDGLVGDGINDESGADDNENEDEEQGNNPEAERRSRKRRTSVQPSSRSAKRQNVGGENSHKVYFRRSRKENGDDIYPRTGDDVGYLRFDARLTTFEGTIKFGMIDEDCVVKGFKTSNRPGQVPHLFTGFRYKQRKQKGLPRHTIL